VIAQIEPLATTHPERAQQMFFLGLALAQSGEVVFCKQVFFISEAWMSIAEPGKALEYRPPKTHSAESLDDCAARPQPLAMMWSSSR